MKVPVVLTKNFCFVTCMVFSLMGYSQTTWKEAFDEGRKLYRQGEYRQALPLFEKALPLAEKEYKKKSEEYALTLTYIGLCAREVQGYGKAEKSLLKARAIYGEVYGKSHPDYATSCDNLAIFYYSQGLYAKAEPLYTEAKKVYEEALGKSHPDYATACLNLAELYRQQKRYAEAELLYVEVKNIREETLGKAHPDYARACNNLAVLYLSQSRYAEAEPLYVETKRIMEETLGKLHPDYITVCYNLAVLYKKQGRYAEAVPLYLEEKKFIEETLGKSHPGYATACHDLAVLYYSQGLYAEAEPLLVEAKKIREETLGKAHPDYISACQNLALIYNEQGRYAEAEPLYVETKKMVEETLGKSHPDFATVCNNLGGLYEAQGRYAEAEALLVEVKKVYEKALGKAHPDYALACNNLGVLYTTQGRYAEAEPLLVETKNVYEKALGKSHPSYATSCNNLAELYKEQGRYAEAEPLLVEAKKIREETLGKAHPDYALACNNLAGLYEEQNRYEEAEPLYVEAKKIMEEVLGKSHPTYATACSALAGLYMAQNRYAEAEPLYLEAKKIREKVLGKAHPDYAASCNNLATLYKKQDRYADAEALLLEAKEVWEKAFGKLHPYYATSCANLALLYQFQGKSAAIIPLFSEANHAWLTQIERNFTGLSEKEKEQFYASFSYNFEFFINFAVGYYPQYPGISGDLYNLALATKGLLLQSTNQVRERILRSGDEELIRLFRQWKGTREEIAKAYSLPIAERQKQALDIILLEKEANELEKVLSARSEAFARSTEKKVFTWQEVQQKLKAGDAAIEMLRIRVFDKKWLDSVHYVALVLKPGISYPEMVVLPQGRQLEGRSLKYYRNCIQSGLSDTLSYHQYWAPLKQAIGDVRRVYFSADGVYHLISLEGLQHGEKEKYVMDEVEVRVVGSTRDLVRGRPAKQVGKVAILAYPDYRSGLSGGPVQAEWQELKRYFTGEQIAMLPGTRIEAEKITEVLTNRGVKVRQYLQADAREEVLKQLEGVDALHIATHGFFIEDVEPMRGDEERGGFFSRIAEVGGNPLLRSGLLLAGAEGAIRGVRAGAEDGILTAYEAQNLNLDGAELVVLSACETGNGEVRNGEGVFGLQRAFQVAGARSVLISLWKVDDAATQELMRLFYENWIGRGQDQRTAFVQAREVLRRRYAHPYYWAAFVLVGE
jgi:CHAT domain-containing protein/Flp pilus assembly protein TadD